MLYTISHNRTLTEKPTIALFFWSFFIVLLFLCSNKISPNLPEAYKVGDGNNGYFSCLAEGSLLQGEDPQCKLPSLTEEAAPNVPFPLLRFVIPASF